MYIHESDFYGISVSHQGKRKEKKSRQFLLTLTVLLNYKTVGMHPTFGMNYRRNPKASRLIT